MTTVENTRLASMVRAIRDRVRQGGTEAETADLVAGALRPFLDEPGLLDEDQLVGDPAGYLQHVLHVEPDGSFSVVALVWLPGQETPVHDHVAWCVTGVHQGAEHEQRYELRGCGADAYLVPVSRVTNAVGEVCGFAPPGDIHLVRNCGDSTAVSIHVYGADIGQLGTSVRRRYDLPVRT